ncbi:MAG: transcription-repair coupling factor [Alphaproteobacteria bacterium]
MISFERLLGAPGRVLIGGAPEGFDALLLARLRASAGRRDVLFVARDEGRMTRTAEALAFFGVDDEVLTLPAWDCLPYDRVSPNPAVASRRIATLARLAERSADDARGIVLLTTVSAAIQRVPPVAALGALHRRIRVGAPLDLEAFIGFLAATGYSRTGTVTDHGEFAVRGGILDVFVAGAERPARIDFFGDDVEAIRVFDPADQKTTGTVATLDVHPMSEVVLDDDTVARFRAGYQALFGVAGNDLLYASISARRRHAGMEHWLPLFHDRMQTVLDTVPGGIVVLDHQAEAAREARLAMIADHYGARTAPPAGALSGEETIYRPVPAERFFLTGETWARALEGHTVLALSPFVEAASEEAGWTAVLDAGGRPARDFAAARRSADANLFDAVRDMIDVERAKGRRVVVAGYTAGSRDRLRGLLADHGVGDLVVADDWAAAEALPRNVVAVTTLPSDHGFETEDVLVLAEQDILGDRLARPAKRARRADAFLAEMAQIAEGDPVVHAEHGIGRYDGLQTLAYGTAQHDCLRLVYDGGDRLYVPVENLDVLTRYGDAEANVALDKLGAASWQARKARLKKRVAEMAGELLKVAAERRLRSAPAFVPGAGEYEEFSARFPYAETDDQGRAIKDVLEGLAAGTPMDILVCGDVGFGKTEVAMRAAFVAVTGDAQVAVVVPTTLLCRQHLATFRARFAGLPMRVEQLSRFVTARESKATKQGMKDGAVDIVIGTHALLAADVEFRNLGLLVIDEEQHFGVKHKEALKRLKADVHVLTLTATPIPRTLQMALTGVRDMSVIATPPVDRLAVRTYVTPYDPVVVREAIQRERFRGGQVYYVCPRIADLDRVVERVRALAPDARIALAHGRLPSRELERIMSAFYDGAIDVLVSTAIVESGLDIPTVNTLVVHRADMYGLAQLYQLRGRIGRGKLRAYAYLTLPPQAVLGHAAEQRLAVLQKLDNLGAGFSLASHDLDIRGAGNLLGAEQSGHIREVGIELYQQMLAEAVEAARAQQSGAPRAAESWSPQIDLGTSVLIPEDYVADLDVRLGLYRRIAGVADKAELDGLAVELADRFGPPPAALDHLLDVVEVKLLCRAANVAKLTAGERGAVLKFRADDFPNPEGLVAYIAAQVGTVKLRPDHRLVFVRDWALIERRLAELPRLLRELAAIAAAPAVPARA